MRILYTCKKKNLHVLITQNRKIMDAQYFFKKNDKYFVGEGSPYTLSNHAVMAIGKNTKSFCTFIYYQTHGHLHGRDEYITTKEGHILQIVCATSLGCQQAWLMSCNFNRGLMWDSWKFLQCWSKFHHLVNNIPLSLIKGTGHFSPDLLAATYLLILLPCTVWELLQGFFKECMPCCPTN